MKTIPNTMMTFALVFAAGTAMPTSLAVAQHEHESQRQTHRTDQKELDSDYLRFATLSSIIDTDIVNANGKTVGTMSDFIVDRGTGRIEYVIVHDGGLLGFGGSMVAIPYGAFGLNSTDQLLLNVTPEAIETAPEFKRERWVDMQSQSWREKLDDRYHKLMNDRSAHDRDGDQADLREIKTMDMEGTIISVDREESHTSGEQVIVRVRSGDNNINRIILGPSWYVMSQDNAPMRGDEIKVTAYPTTRDGEKAHIGQHARINGRTMTLRDDDGHPAWMYGPTGEERELNTKYKVHSPFVMLSDIVGMDATARYEDGGEIDGAIIELESGRAVFLVLDPDENFLGIADTTRVVPWSVAAIGDTAVHFDATRDMLLASEAKPDDVQDFAVLGRRNAVYQGFSVNPVKFKPRGGANWQHESGMSGWGEDGVVCKAIRTGEHVSISGTIQRTRTLNLNHGDMDAMAVDVKTADGMKTVVLGPIWYLKRQQEQLVGGDSVIIQAKKATVHGETNYFATEVATRGSEALRLWIDQQPAWLSG